VFYKQAEHYSSTAEIILYANEAYVHYRLGNKLLARKAYEKGLAVFNSQPHSIRTELVLLRTESDILWLEEKYFPARQSADRCLALAESEALPLETGLCHLSRVRARIALGFHDGVITELLEALRLTEQAKAHSWEMEIHRELASTYELFSNYRQSLAHHKIYYSQNKALLFDRRQSELFLLQESYETNALQQQKALAESEASVAKLKVDKQRLRNWTVIAFTFVVLMSFVQIRRRAKDTLLENKQLAKLHQQDPLTGLGNRRYIDNWLEEDYQPEQGKHYFIALADIDDFKRINDTHGHDVGDSVIVETARRLRKVIGRDEAVVRWGGEEFLLVLKSGNQPQLKLEQIVSEISERPYEMQQDSLAITVSVGASDLCESLTQEHSFELLTKQADRALYCAKSEGKNHAQQYDAARHSSNSDVD
jgi:diguanylate cyclase (GGDEF)-like protein